MTSKASSACQQGIGFHRLETNPISVKFDPKADIMLGATFVKVVCGDNNMWGYSAASWTWPGTWPKKMPRTLLRAPTIDAFVVDLTVEIAKKTTR